MSESEAVEERFYRRRPVAADLRGLVTGVYAYTGGRPARETIVEPASLTIPLIVNLGAPYGIGLGRKPGGDDSHGSFVAGLFAGPVWIDSNGGSECVQVNLTPIGARRLLGRPMSDLTDRMVSLDEVDDCEFATLPERVAAAPTWDERLALVEKLVVRRLRACEVSDTSVVWAFDQIVRHGGKVRIAALAKRLDWSRRKLVERFHRDCGLPPKAIARIVRFNAAQAMAAAVERPDWADIAIACGYSDQPHLIREFVAFAGVAPTQWRFPL